MDHELTALRRRLKEDPQDTAATEALARTLAQTGRLLEGYELLLEIGAVQRKEPQAMELGAELARQEQEAFKAIAQRAGRKSAAAFEPPINGSHRWRPFKKIKKPRLPLRALQLRGPKISDALLQRLRELPGLRFLKLERCPRLSDAGFAVLADLQDLNELDITSCVGLTATGLVAAAAAPSLEKLTLCRLHSIDDDALAALAASATLSSLTLDGLTITSEAIPALAALELTAFSWTGDPGRDPVVSAIAALTSLRKLELCTRFEVRGQSLDELAALPELESLTLPRAEISELAFEGLADFPALKQLKIPQSYGLTAAGMLHLAKATQLEELDLSQTNLEDTGLAALTGLTRLQILDLSRTCVRDGGLPSLCRFPQLKILGLAGTEITDAGLAALGALPAIEKLNLAGCRQLTIPGLRALQPLTGTLRSLDLRTYLFQADGARDVLPFLDELQTWSPRDAFR